MTSDENKNKLYAPPRKDKYFKFYWNLLIEEITLRENFKPSHLLQLKVLCDLYVEYDRLMDIIEVQGTTYVTGGHRHGDQEKLRPEVSQKNVILTEIRNREKSMGLVLVKDSESSTMPKEEEWK